MQCGLVPRGKPGNSLAKRPVHLRWFRRAYGMTSKTMKAIGRCDSESPAREVNLLLVIVRLEQKEGRRASTLVHQVRQAKVVAAEASKNRAATIVADIVPHLLATENTIIDALETAGCAPAIPISSQNSSSDARGH